MSQYCKLWADTCSTFESRRKVDRKNCELEDVPNEQNGQNGQSGQSGQRIVCNKGEGIGIPCVVLKQDLSNPDDCDPFGCFNGNGIKLGDICQVSTVSSQSGATVTTASTGNANGQTNTAGTRSSGTGTFTSNPSTSTSPSAAITTSTPPKDPSNGGIGGGAAAGIAVGSLIVGALLASLALWFLLLRKRRSNQTSASYLEGSATSRASGNGKQQQPNITYGAVAPIDRYLPQPAEDDAITGELSKIRDKIKNHTQSFYHTSPVNAQDIDQSGLLDLAHATGISTSHLADLLANPHTRLTAIRLYLAWIILSRVGLEPLIDNSYLPNKLSTLVASTSANSKDPGKIILATKWKAITAELLQDSSTHQTSRDRHVERSASEAIQSADLVLKPFIKSAGDEAGSDKRLRNLESAIKKAAQFAFLLFSQPSLFVFDWASRNNELVVFPGLYQTVGDDGIARSPPRPFGETEVSRV